MGQSWLGRFVPALALMLCLSSPSRADDKGKTIEVEIDRIVRDAVRRALDEKASMKANDRKKTATKDDDDDMKTTKKKDDDHDRKGTRPRIASVDEPSPNVVLVIHGGAGVKPKKEMTVELRKKYEADLTKALEEGYKTLKRDKGTSVDAVEAAIRVLEDSPRFNAGKGAVFTNDFRNELDASIMEGKNRNAGSVAGVTIIRNPISAARVIMEKSPHVMMVGRGAERFASENNIETVDPSYFWTQERWDALKKAQEEEKKNRNKGVWTPPLSRYFGTVGAVAVDRHGNIAAGTSTGGMTNKRFGRVGDSPIIGAGTYADNAACGVSCTGHGEIFIRHAVAYDVAARMKYKKLGIKDAAVEAIKELPEEEGGVGGLIALDARGNVAMPYSKETEGMYRGYITSDGKIKVMIYED